MSRRTARSPYRCETPSRRITRPAPRPWRRPGRRRPRRWRRRAAGRPRGPSTRTAGRPAAPPTPPRDGRARSPRRPGRPACRRVRVAGSRPQASVQASTWAAKASVISSWPISASASPARRSARSTAGHRPEPGQRRVDAGRPRPPSRARPGSRGPAAHPLGDDGDRGRAVVDAAGVAGRDRARRRRRPAGSREPGLGQRGSRAGRPRLTAADGDDLLGEGAAVAGGHRQPVRARGVRVLPLSGDAPGARRGRRPPDPCPGRRTARARTGPAPAAARCWRSRRRRPARADCPPSRTRAPASRIASSPLPHWRSTVTPGHVDTQAGAQGRDPGQVAAGSGAVAEHDVVDVRARQGRGRSSSAASTGAARSSTATSAKARPIVATAVRRAATTTGVSGSTRGGWAGRQAWRGSA